ncbi:hypothetical protein ASD11_17505 [Aeromicrobium sp. Root495]|uniref:FAD-binding oxidoreductase n=1 Tax=Aeromicrobium sp. Root495 TaxID=1736550 RepID=UPI0006FA7E69|nr:FAD-binding oxidoreductase [Aeromicrobium sp. Root495]KQY55339.1 hypothetical protein ASD11_17505 [Aeromicrobium sp. Root495]
MEPTSVAEVSRLVQEVADDPAGLHVHAISSGKNWGFGSAEPVTDGALVMDLRRLDAIRVLDTDAGVCVVEPGVSQGRLAQELVGSGFLLNVTASASATSVVGNILERGVGLRRQRSEDVIGLEVVLADGTVAKVGRWPREGARTTPYDHVPGPGTVQLFAQSSLAVVTAAVVRLIPDTEELRVVRLRFTRDHLEAALTHLKGWHADRLVAGVIKVFDTSAVTAYGGDSPPTYQVYLPVAGRAAVVAVITELIEQEATAEGTFEEVDVLDPDQPVGSVAEQAALRGYAGDPSANDAMVRAIFDTPLDEVDVRGRDGWLFCVPVAPLAPSALVEVVDIIQVASARFGQIVVGHTLNVLPSGWVDVVVSIRFERSTEHVAVAHLLLDELHVAFTEHGFPPYRLDIDHMDDAAGLRGDAGQEEVLDRIKQALDPQGVLARGRYA